MKLFITLLSICFLANADNKKVGSIEPLLVSKDLSKKDGEKVELQVRVYQAKSLGIGKFYSQRAELVDATLLSEFRVVSDVGNETVMSKEGGSYHMKSNVVYFEDKLYAGVKVLLLHSEQEFDWYNVIKIGGYRLVEFSKQEGSELLYVYDVSIKSTGDRDE